MRIGKYSTLALILSVSIFSGCGSSSSNDSSSTSINGAVADGYLVGAKVCSDTNENGICDPSEPFAISNINGKYEIHGTKSSHLDTHTLIAEVNASTIDEDTNLAVGKEYRLSSVPNETFISPVSSTVRNYMIKNNTTLEAAKKITASRLGLTSADDILKDYVKDGNSVVHNYAKVIASLKVLVAEKIKNLDEKSFNDYKGEALETYINSVIEQNLENVAKNVKAGDSIESIIGSTDSSISVSNCSEKLKEIKDELNKDKPVTVSNDGEPTLPTFTKEIEREGHVNPVFTTDEKYIPDSLTWEINVNPSNVSWYSYSTIMIDYKANIVKNINSHTGLSSKGAFPDIFTCSEKVIKAATDTSLKESYVTCKAIDANGNVLTENTEKVVGSDAIFTTRFDYVTKDGYYYVKQKGGSSFSFNK